MSLGKRRLAEDGGDKKECSGDRELHSVYSERLPDNEIYVGQVTLEPPSR